MCSAISCNQLWIDLRRALLPACALLLYSCPDDVMPEAYITRMFEVMPCDIDDAQGQL